MDTIPRLYKAHCPDIGSRNELALLFAVAGFHLAAINKRINAISIFLEDDTITIGDDKQLEYEKRRALRNYKYHFQQGGTVSGSVSIIRNS